jgi:hypothetical protein
MKKSGSLLFLLILLLLVDAALLAVYIYTRTLAEESAYVITTSWVVYALVIFVLVLVLAAIILQIRYNMIASKANKEELSTKEEEAIEPKEEVQEEQQVVEEEKEVVEEEPVALEESKTEEAQPIEEPTPTPVQEEFDGKVEVPQRSFLARLLKSDEELKDAYSDLMNTFLGYKKVKARMSFRFETIKIRNEVLAKMQVRGKSIALYLALPLEELEGTKYNVKPSPESKAFIPVPTKFLVRGPRKLAHAKQLIELLMAKFQVELNPKYVQKDFKAELPILEEEALKKERLIKIRKQKSIFIQ